MKKLFYLMFLAIAMASCQNNSQQAAPPNSTSEAENTPEDFTACYIRALGRDTTWVKITIAADGTVSGTYDWVPYETDSARGTLSGQKQGDLLRLMYDYTIEGSQQQQEMLMTLSDGVLAEAEGELVENENGVLVLKDTSQVNYLPMVKVQCP